jgi:glycosyltransferase involved in cell wall biosynthesis
MNSEKNKKTLVRIPVIDPVPSGIKRPLWSVMIPTYNCAEYLIQTLRSVLSQDPGPEHMQIEVVDDCSTNDDPQKIVSEYGKGRVSFHRRASNGGVTSNFNTCVQRSVGHLVHILHGDDYVLDSFYKKLESEFDGNKSASMIASRSFFIDEHNIIMGVTKYIPRLNDVSNNPSEFFYECPIQCPGVVVRRTFYENFGGFDHSLVHSADWEMWTRAFGFSGGIVLSDVLSCYRQTCGNDSGRLMKTAENLRDYERLALIYKARYPEYDLTKGMKIISSKAFQQALRFRVLGDSDAEKMNIKYWKSRTPAISRVIKHASRMVKGGLSRHR